MDRHDHRHRDTPEGRASSGACLESFRDQIEGIRADGGESLSRASDQRWHRRPDTQTHEGRRNREGAPGPSDLVKARGAFAGTMRASLLCRVAASARDAVVGSAAPAWGGGAGAARRRSPRPPPASVHTRPLNLAALRPCAVRAPRLRGIAPLSMIWRCTRQVAR